MKLGDRLSAKDYVRPEFEIQGNYCSVGPVLQVAVTDEYLAANSVPINGPEFHEYIHFYQITPSTIGLLDAALASLPLGNHQRLVEISRGLSLRQPYINQMQTSDMGSITFRMLDGVLNIQALRAFLGGYPDVVTQDGDFYREEAHVLKAARSFSHMCEALFGQESVAYWSDLDGRSASSVNQRPAPAYPGGYALGANAIYETYACAAQAIAIADAGTDIVSPEMLRADLDLAQSHRPEIELGALERLATALITPVTNLGQAHAWRARIDSHTSTLYRAGALLLFRQVKGERPPTILRAPMIETILAFSELALNPPIFPAHLPMWQRKPTWHDIHPGYRYANLCHCLRRVGFAPKLDSSTAWHEALWEYIDSVCEYMEWPLHSKVVAASTHSDVGLIKDSSAVTPYQKNVYVQLNAQKLASLPSVFLAMIPNGSDVGPAATIEYSPGGSAEGRILDARGMRAALVTTILYEFYFSDNLGLSISLLEGFPDQARRDIAESLEHELGIRGLSDALQARSHSSR
jgi:hypothetical protein